MSHYQKLATIIFRSVALIFMLIGAAAGLIGLVVSLLFSFGVPGLFIGIFYSLPLIVLGIVLFSLSRFLARFVCNDFDEFKSA